MANDCITFYRVVGDRNQMEKLYNTMKRLQETPDAELDNPRTYGRTWLGRLVKEFGGDPKEIYCRGYWEQDTMELHEDRLVFNTVTAWREMYETFHFLEGVFPDLTFYYAAEECGCEYYVTNDPTWDEMHMVIDCEYIDGVHNVAEAATIIEKELGIAGLTTLEECQETLREYDEENDTNSGLYEYEMVNW